MLHSARSVPHISVCNYKQKRSSLPGTLVAQEQAVGCKSSKERLVTKQVGTNVWGVAVAALGVVAIVMTGCTESEPPGTGSFSVTKCSPSGHCSAGGRCAMGVCLEECMSDADCGMSGAICQGGLCVSGGGGMCASDSDCPMGESCAMGVCTAPPPPVGCMSDADCPMASTCQMGACTSICGAESCNMLDDDCDGAIDEYCSSPPGMCAADADCPMGQRCIGGRCGSPPVACMSDMDCASGQVCVGGICQTGGMCHPRPEICNMIDDDCDGVIDEGCGGTACMADSDCRMGERCLRGVCTSGMGGDADGDGYPAGIDCDDMDPSVHPGATEVCDMRDNDCDGAIDEGCTMCVPSPEICNMLDDDCDGAIDEGCVMCAPSTEVCNGLDDDCDGFVDEGCGGCMTDADCPMGLSCIGFVCQPGRDADGDGYPAGVDCNDLDPSVHPGATELCDMLDNDCDGAIDEGCVMCVPSAELCNMVDDDCDGFIDEGCSGSPCMSHADCMMGEYCVAGICTSGMGGDADGDGYPVSSDCDDSNPTIHPGAIERCNMLDDNCNGVVDEMCI